MTVTKMIVPKTITVGYNSRRDTYTGKLAYVIYTDDKGVLRKEKSWQSWRNQKLGSDQFDNVPTTGFVLNKGVGGARESYGWNARNEYVRVYDPRNFEFEISVRNLLFILQECSAIKGKGLEGEFVYAWDGTELVLLPVNCKEYEECVKHTNRQTMKFDKKDIKEGCSYIMKDGTEVLYLGRLNYNNTNHYYKRFNPVGKKHVFLNLSLRKSKEREYDPYIAETGFTKIAECISLTPSPQFPDEYDLFKKSIYCGDVKVVKLNKVTFIEQMCGKLLVLKENDKHYMVRVDRDYNRYYYSGRGYQYDYRLFKSKEFVPEVTENVISLPTLPKDSIEVNKANMRSYDLYELKIVTEKGRSLELYR